MTSNPEKEKAAEAMADLQKLTQKAEKYGIKVLLADRWYPSSKRCSKCGNIKTDLKLSDRVYSCECCGNRLDRDLNAAINLQQLAIYPEGTGEVKPAEQYINISSQAIDEDGCDEPGRNPKNI